MLNANELLQKGISQVKSAGINPGDINPKVIINSRAKSRFGLCRKTPGKHDYQIEINNQLLETEEFKAMNTMIHEILHTCKGCMNHGKDWKFYANVMNIKFGYDISRTSSYEKLGIEVPEAKFIVKCNDCGNETKRQKKTKLITHTSHYRCGMCDGELTLI
ncbi:MAG TPA: sprT domain-containing protein [Clostridiales bacterium]|nr:sprT domain-containing protein [Clostridiales bacterium]